MTHANPKLEGLKLAVSRESPVSVTWECYGLLSVSPFKPETRPLNDFEQNRLLYRVGHLLTVSTLLTFCTWQSAVQLKPRAILNRINRIHTQMITGRCLGLRCHGRAAQTARTRFPAAVLLMRKLSKTAKSTEKISGHDFHNDLSDWFGNGQFI